MLATPFWGCFCFCNDTEVVEETTHRGLFEADGSIHGICIIFDQRHEPFQTLRQQFTFRANPDRDDGREEGRRGGQETERGVTLSVRKALLAAGHGNGAGQQ